MQSGQHNRRVYDGKFNTWIVADDPAMSPAGEWAQVDGAIGACVCVKGRILQATINGEEGANYFVTIVSTALKEKSYCNDVRNPFGAGGPGQGPAPVPRRPSPQGPPTPGQIPDQNSRMSDALNYCGWMRKGEGQNRQIYDAKFNTWILANSTSTLPQGIGVA